MTLRRLKQQEKMQMIMNKTMEMTLRSALIRPAGPVVMIPTEPDELTPRTVTKSVITKSGKKIETSVPLTLEKRKISARGK